VALAAINIIFNNNDIL